MIFKNPPHLVNFRMMNELDNTSPDDTYRRAFFYIVAFNNELTSHIRELYDFESHSLIFTNPEHPFYGQGWHTGTSRRLYNLAINLYNDSHPADISEISHSWGDDLEYIFEGIRIRFKFGHSRTEPCYK